MKTTNITEIQIITTGHYEKIQVNNLDRLEEIDKFIETYKLPKCKQEEIENLNRPINSKELESVTKNKQKQNKKNPTKNAKKKKTKQNWKQTKVEDQTASYANFTKHLKKS